MPASGINSLSATSRHRDAERTNVACTGLYQQAEAEGWDLGALSLGDSIAASTAFSAGLWGECATANTSMFSSARSDNTLVNFYATMYLFFYKLKKRSEKMKSIIEIIKKIMAVKFVRIALGLFLLSIALFVSYFAAYNRDSWRVHPDEVEVRDWIASVDGLFHSRDDNERHITSVHFRNCDITDDDLIRLKQLSKLRLLEISDIDITDQAIPTLVSLRSLETLNLRNTKITEEGREQLHKEHPVPYLTVNIEITDGIGYRYVPAYVSSPDAETAESKRENRR